jgi:hypothetical protein
MSLPLGPVETGPCWFAPGRLAFATFCSKVRAAHLPGGCVNFIIFSRVVEKSSLMTMQCLDLVIAEIGKRWGWDPITDVYMISDGGGAFKSYRMLACAAAVWPEEIQVSPRRIVSWHMAYGAESHGKSTVDAVFAEVSRRVKGYSQHTMMSTIADVMEAMRVGQRAISSAHPLELFYDFMPSVERTVFEAKRRCCVPSSLPSAIRLCHFWTMRVADKRRACLVGTDKITVTGTYTTASLLPSMPPSAPVHMRLCATGEDEEGSGGEVEESATPASLVPMNTHFLGLANRLSQDPA